MIKRGWILELIKGVIIMLFGLFFLINPGVVSLMVAWVLAVIMILTAVIAMADALVIKKTFRLYWLLFIEAVIDIAVAIIIIIKPESTSFVLQIVGIWMIASALFRVVRTFDHTKSLRLNVIMFIVLMTIGILFLAYTDVIVKFFIMGLGVIILVFGLYTLVSAYVLTKKE